MNPRRGLWTLSTRTWFASFAVAISVLVAWVGVGAAASARLGPPAAAGSPAAGSSSGGVAGLPAEGEPGADEATDISLAEPPLLGKSAMEVLGLLVVREPDSGADYQRTRQFGEAWLDVDGNGCSTREDILLRDLSGTSLNGCKVMSGSFVDPYSGRPTEFTRGNDTSMLVQIDHIVALNNAWTTGAQLLSPDQRQRLANDPTNLLAVSEETNQAKGAADASTWLPPFGAIHCEYVARQISVKFAYGLWVTPAEHDALLDVLRTCPDQPAYRSSLGTASAPQPFAPTPAPAERPDGVGDTTYYENCSAAYAAGVRRIPRGAPGYRPELDRDDDGIACEG